MEKFQSKIESALKSSTTVIEYFLTVGLTSKNFNDYLNEQSSLTPSILSQFPPFARTEAQIPESIPVFCFPWGIKLSKSRNSPEVFYMMLTDESGNKLFCTCLKIWELQEDIFSGDYSDPIQNSHFFAEDSIFVPKCLVIVSRLAFYEAFEEILRKLYDLSKICLLTKIEWFVLNLVMHVPTPPKGHTKVLYKLGDLEKEFKLPPMNKLPLLDLNLTSLFLALSLENLIKAFTCLALECSLVFVSQDDSKLSKGVMALLALLFPFQWSLVCVPILPEVLLDYLYSPVSYVYGIAAHLKDEVKLRGSESLFIVDLDNNSVTCNAEYLKVSNEYSSPVNLPQLPPHYSRKLTKRVSKLIENWKQKNDYNKDADKKALSFDQGTCDDIRESFFQFFVSILKNYKEFLRFNSANEQIGCFDEKGFIKTWPESARPFLARFTKTQMFANFCEIRLRPQNIEEHSENLLFDESILAKLNRSSLRYSKYETPFINDSTQVWKNIWKVPETGPLIDMRTYSYKCFPEITIESLQDCPLPKEKLPKFQETIDFSYNIPVGNTRVTPLPKEQILFCWLQMWAACLWYQDLSEHSLRYKEVKFCLEEFKKISLMSLTGIYKNLLEACARVNPSLGMPIFKIMTDSQVMVDAATIHLLQRILALSIKKDQKQPKHPNSIFFTNSPINENFVPNVYRRRVFTKANDSHIFAKQELCFLIKETCSDCKKFLNLKEIQCGWQSDPYVFDCFCTGCKEKYTPNLRVRIGLEVGHQQKTSNKENTIFFSPWNLKALVNDMLTDPSNKFKLDVELFRIYNANVFWNLIWHFNNYQLPFEFMLPYEEEVVNVKSSFIIVGDESEPKVKVDKEVQTLWSMKNIEDAINRYKGACV